MSEGGNVEGVSEAASGKGFARSGYPYRVFICYGHEDIGLVRKIDQALQRIGLQPWWSELITPGTPFPEAIKTMIAHCHIFMPVLTATSRGRPWVHQEIGYALALGVPVLPVAVGQMPADMLAELHAVSIEVEWSVEQIAKALGKIDFRQLVTPPPPAPPRVVETTDFHEERTRLLAEYARHVLQVAGPVRVRQLARMSSLSIPDAEPSDPEWDRRDGTDSPALHYYRALRRQERQVIEEHVRHAGGDFIISPQTVRRALGSEKFASRLFTLRETLQALADAEADLRVLVRPDTRERNLTILGDWFAAEAFFVAASGGYRKTVFHWHGPTVLRWIEWFDREFEYLQAQAKRGAGGVVGPEPGEVIEHLGQMLRAVEVGQGGVEGER